MFRSLVVVTSALLLSAPALAHAAEGDIIVKRAPGADRGAVRADAGVDLVKTLPLERTELVEPAPGETLSGALAALNADDDVVYAEPDRVATATRMPPDSYFNQLWGLHNTGQDYGIVGADIDAPLAWDRSEGAGVTVAVADTGINAGHVDLSDQITGNPAEVNGVPGVDDDGNRLVDDYRGWDFVSGDNLPQDGHGHGTHVAGTIAGDGDNQAGVIGVAPRAKVVPLRVLGNSGSGSMSAIAAAFDYAGKAGIRVVNASLGGGYSQAVRDAIAAHPNTLYVVAAGNDAANADTDADSFPCALPEANIVCVGATDNRDAPAAFSNYGGTAVDLYAPGVDIVSAYRGYSMAYVLMSGTSMASPHVAGAAALALALRPDASTHFLRWALLSSGDAKPALAGLSVTGARLNANAALTAIQGTEPVEPTVATPEPPVETPVPETPPTATIPPPDVPEITPLPTAPKPALTIGKLTVRSGKVSFRLSHASSLKLTLTRSGKRVKTWTVRGKAGANAVKLPTRKAGAYTLTLSSGAVSRSGAFRLR